MDFVYPLLICSHRSGQAQIAIPFSITSLSEHIPLYPPSIHWAAGGNQSYISYLNAMYNCSIDMRLAWEEATRDIQHHRIAVYRIMKEYISGNGLCRYSFHARWKTGCICRGLPGISFKQDEGTPSTGSSRNMLMDGMPDHPLQRELS